MDEKRYLQLIEVDPMRVKFNERNPRQHQGAEFLRLRESVKAIGVVQQPTVRVLAGGFYECIDGEGRIRAAQEAGLATIWVVSVGIIDDLEALAMLQAANVVREFSYLASCKGLATLHRQGQSSEAIARSIGVSGKTVLTDISVGYFPPQTLALIEQDLLHAQEESSQETRSFSWTASTFFLLLPLRIQLKKRDVTGGFDGLYDYTEVHRAVEHIINGKVKTLDLVHSYVERRRRELFEERFDKALQQRLQEELAQTRSTLEEAQQQSLQDMQTKVVKHYETQVSLLQESLQELEKRHQKLVKEVARRPDMIEQREQELQLQLQGAEEERRRLQELQRHMQEQEQARRHRLEQELKEQAARDLKKQREAMEKHFAQVRRELEDYYEQQDQKRQVRAEKTIRQAIAHGTELLSQSQQWLLLLITPEMIKGLTWLREPEMVSLLAQLRAVRQTLEQAEELLIHGDVPDTVSAEESVFHG